MEVTKHKIKSAYIASPLGFSEAGRLWYEGVLKPKLRSINIEIIDPWGLTKKEQIDAVQAMQFGTEQREAWKDLDLVIGRHNMEGLDRADMVIAILDGVDVDSGTASEIGYAAGKGKFIEGYRGDFRLSADNIGSIVNLQVEYFIRSHNGDISFTVEDLVESLKRKYIIG